MACRKPVSNGMIAVGVLKKGPLWSRAYNTVWLCTTPVCKHNVNDTLGTGQTGSGWKVGIENHIGNT